jgi:hypothetical protein
MIGMPAKNSDGSHRQGWSDGMYYCDAGNVGGAYCPEFDIMEANTFAWRAVNHHCTDNGNGHYTWCDHNGTCAVDIITDFPNSDPYGPGIEYTINTLFEFNTKIEFFEDAQGNFNQYTITLS